MLHLAWGQDQLTVVGWHGRALSADRVQSLAATLFERDLELVTTGLTIPGRRDTAAVHGAHIPISAAVDAFLVNSWIPWKTLSASLAWGSSVARLGREVATNGQVVPSLVAPLEGAVEATMGLAHWVPTVDAVIARQLVALTETMPPVFGAFHPNAAPWQLTWLLLSRFVDDLVRVRLNGAESGGPPMRDRRPGAIVARRVLHALTTDGQVATTSPLERSSLNFASGELGRWSAPVTARSPLADYSVFLRLEPVEDDDANPDDEANPDDNGDTDAGETDAGEADRGSVRGADPDDGWFAELLVAPSSDPSLYLSAEYVWRPQRATTVAFDLTAAQGALRYARQRLLASSPTLTPALLGSTEPTRVGLTVAQVVEIVHHELPAITAAGVNVQLPSLWTKPRRVRTVGRATPTEAPLVSGGLSAKELVRVDWRVVLGDQELSDDELRRLAEAKEELVRISGRWTVIDPAEVAKALTAVTRLRRDRPVRSAVELLGLAGELETGDASDQPPVSLTTTGWVTELLAGLPDERLEPVTAPHGFTGTLRPYQQRGVGWLSLLSRLGLGGVLADDMGLGKTAQMLALISHEGTGPTLIICPLSVVHNWETEAGRFVPHLRVGVHHGPSRVTDADEFQAWRTTFDLVITTFATATVDAALFEQTPWDRLVVDEAQHIKNSSTKAARAIRRVPARQRVAMTGTPVENRLSDLWSVMDLVNPGVLGTAEQFRKQVARPIERDRDDAVARRLRATVAPLLLRRSKADKSLVPELPDKIEATAWATLTREQASLYRAVTNHLMERLPKLTGMQRRAAIVTAITRLKQICNHPAHYLGDGGRIDGRSGKLTRFDELVDAAFEADDQVLAFTQYVEMGTLVQRHLSERYSLTTPFLHGGIAKRARDGLVARFQQGDVPLLLVSLKAGGSGLNLTAASQVVHIDRWWNPAVEDQASDRAWRIGQTSTVLVHKLTTRGTIEERIDTLMAEKRDLADRVLGTKGEESWVTELSIEEIRRLVELEQ